MTQTKSIILMTRRKKYQTNYSNSDIILMTQTKSIILMTRRKKYQTNYSNSDIILMTRTSVFRFRSFVHIGSFTYL